MKADERKILSIIIPTKNRCDYLKKTLDLLLSIDSDCFEIIIQDNSDNNDDIVSYLSKYDTMKLKYFYCWKPLSIIENSDLAIKNSSGEYICYIGDDDLVSRYIVQCVSWMKLNEIDSLITTKPNYVWPDVFSKVFNFSGSLRVKKFDGHVTEINLKDELNQSLKIACNQLRYLPRVYHGIVNRSILDEVYAKTGSYFPGPSPDMANAISLCFTSKKHIYLDIPIIISGTAYNSGGGMGARHKHIGEIKDLPFLPKNTDENWEVKVPKFWTGQTIYAESSIKALRRMGESMQLSKFNYSYLYASLLVFHFNKRERFSCFINQNNLIYVIFFSFFIVLNRIVSFIVNVLIKFKLARDYDHFYGVENVNQCEKLICKLIDSSRVISAVEIFKSKL